MSGDATRGFAERRVRRWRDGVVSDALDRVAEEVPVALLYNDRPHVVMMATPCDIDDFALGFSLSEAIVARAGEVESIESAALIEGIEVRVHIPAAAAAVLEQRHRNLTGRTSCGLCGAQALEDAIRQPPRVDVDLCIPPAALDAAFSQLQRRQPLNAQTGATHAAAWAREDGSIVLVREDVGRHTALDKLVGAIATAGLDPRAGILLLTSRASYEIVQKAATVGIGFVAAISAPTSLAIHLAEETGVTLVGFARSATHVAYANARRLSHESLEVQP